MSADLIEDRGNGPVVAGTRITIYNLVPDFLDPTATEDHICKLYDLTPEQVAAARAFVLRNADTVLARHMAFEDRNAAGNPPEVAVRAAEGRQVLLRFKDWLAQKERDELAAKEANGRAVERRPTFREWMAEREATRAEGS